MIKEALTFLTSELDTYWKVKTGSTQTEKKVVLANIAKIGDPEGNTLKNAIVASLVNLEEDRLSKSPNNFVKQPSGIVYKNPKIHLYLYLLFAIDGNYDQSLRDIGLVIQFFQKNNLFNRQSHPSLHEKIELLVADLHTLSFEQSNHMWSILGSKYLPSALYKVRIVSIEDETPDGDGTPIKTIFADIHDYNR